MMQGANHLKKMHPLYHIPSIEIRFLKLSALPSTTVFLETYSQRSVICD